MKRKPSLHKWVPCKRKDFIKKLKSFGFNDLEAGARHGVMRCRSHKQIIPSNREYSVPQLKRLLKQVEEKLGYSISVEKWNNL